MHARPPSYQIHRSLADHFPHLRPAHTRGLALWIYGAILAHSACQNAILAVRAPLGNRETIRQRLRATFRPDATCAPTGGPRRLARLLVPGPGHGWVGTGTAFQPAKQQAGTLVVVWEAGQDAPWLLLTDLTPDAVGVLWYGLRVWVESGFRVLKSMGWQWERTQRTGGARVARHWLVLAVATLWTVAVGTRVEEAQARALCPTRLWRPPRHASALQRAVSLFAQGWGWLLRQAVRGRFWRRLGLLPEAWPSTPAGLTLCYHAAPI
jgi:hypothetical protein